MASHNLFMTATGSNCYSSPETAGKLYILNENSMFTIYSGTVSVFLCCESLGQLVFNPQWANKSPSHTSANNQQMEVSWYSIPLFSTQSQTCKQSSSEATVNSTYFCLACKLSRSVPSTSAHSKFSTHNVSPLQSALSAPKLNGFQCVHAAGSTQHTPIVSQ